MDGVQLPQGQSHFEKAVQFLPNSPEVAGTHFTNLGAVQWFLTRTPGLGTQHLNQQAIEATEEATKIVAKSIYLSLYIYIGDVDMKYIWELKKTFCRNVLSKNVYSTMTQGQTNEGKMPKYF